MRSHSSSAVTIICCVMFLCSITQTAYASSCEVILRIFEYKEDGSTENYPVTDAKITVLKAGTKKGPSAKLAGGALTVALEQESDYSIEIRKKGFKTTRDSVGCLPIGVSIPNSRIFFIWPGDAKVIMQPSVYSGAVAVDDRDRLSRIENSAPSGDSRSESDQAAESRSRKVPSKIGGGLTRISGGVINGNATRLARPEYPAAAEAVRASGVVSVQVTIDELGYVISATAVSGHPLLRSASEKAARESRFPTTFLEGYPVKVTGVIVYNFMP